MQGVVKGLAHGVKLTQGGGNELSSDQPTDFIFSRHVIFLHLVGLFQEALFEFYQVPVVPMEQRDLAFRMLDFADDSHWYKVVKVVGLSTVDYTGGTQGTFSPIMTNIITAWMNSR